MYRGTPRRKNGSNSFTSVLPQLSGCKAGRRMARPEGFEPPTLCLEGRRSIRLSYGRTVCFQ